MMLIYNLQTLVSICIGDKDEESDFIYQPATTIRKWFGFNKELPERFYYRWSYLADKPYYTQTELETGSYKGYRMLIQNNKAYYRPYAMLTFVNNEKRSKRFDTYEEALAWGTDQANRGMNIQLIL